jgi:hypothetical protein
MSFVLAALVLLAALLAGAATPGTKPAAAPDRLRPFVCSRLGAQ